jgi:hypothetical protein
MEIPFAGLALEQFQRHLECAGALLDVLQLILDENQLTGVGLEQCRRHLEHVGLHWIRDSSLDWCWSHWSDGRDLGEPL